MTGQNLHLNFEDNIAILALDMAGKSANILSPVMITELSDCLQTLSMRADLDGLILRSAKQSGFVFGADITAFQSLTTLSEVRAMQEHAMAMLDTLSSLPFPTIAFVHGPALGGGLELALACDYRLFSSTHKIMAGFPEVNLGLIPGFAGTARASRLLGTSTALSLCATGKPMTKADDVLNCGLADGMATDETLLAEAKSLMKAGKPDQKQAVDNADIKDVAATLRRDLIGTKPAEHHPHLIALCDHFIAADGNYEELVRGELSIFPALMLGDVSHGLRRVFQLTDKVKKQGRGTCDIDQILVIGAGTMGADIATFLALKGKIIYLSDIDEMALQRAKSEAERYFRRKLPEEDALEAAANFHAGLPDNRASEIDLVIEAVPEKLALKQSIWRELEPKMRKDTVFATNTSALDLTEIASKMVTPSRLIGLHFFNPATIMPLIEVIYQNKDPLQNEMVDKLMILAGSLGKMPVKVRNSAGFIVNRALLPYLYEGLSSVMAGQKADAIDEAMLAFGMPMGPIELADQIGLDVCVDVGRHLALDDAVSDMLDAKIAKGQLGRKSGQGLYVWHDKMAERNRAQYDQAEMLSIQNQLLTPLIAACQQVLSNGDVDDADMIDAAMIFGTGFPRHTGGPLFYANNKDANERDIGQRDIGQPQSDTYH